MNPCESQIFGCTPCTTRRTLTKFKQHRLTTTRNGILRNLGVPQVNGLYGGQSCILAQLVGQSEWLNLPPEFRGGCFSEWCGRPLKGLAREFSGPFSLLRLPEKPAVRKRTPCPGSTPRPLLSSQISTTLVNFNVVFSMLINKYNCLPLYDRTINLVYINLSIED
ncbi:hypothetical protein TNCV_582221 [Trichonephila clavipes]|nr:hypothetical protein TNCV_582221 [Trichonephila clavipes]